MNWEKLRLQLEQILNAELRYDSVSQALWRQVETPSIEHNNEILFFLDKENSWVHIFAIDAAHITPKERQLIEVMIEASRIDPKSQKLSSTAEEKKMNLLKEWIHSQLNSGEVQEELPEVFASQSALFSAKVPLLLYESHSENKKVDYKELSKLLETFFSVEMMLIPLMDKEWLILCPESLLDGEDDWGEENIETSLESICSGLYDMMVSEGIGECHVSIHYPMVPSKLIISTIENLRETISLGRTYHLSQHIHLPWLLHIERILHLIPEKGKKSIVENVLNRNNYSLDNEIRTTLEHFFELNCNVSETAKKLYIHRNTLLYRLDKFKQETGLDVRNFRDAVIVKISLLLYKVTKRQ